MADFTLNRTVEDKENELYELSYDIADIAALESDTILGHAYSAWCALVKNSGAAPPDTVIRSMTEKTTEFSADIYRVCCSHAGTEFAVDDNGRDALHRMGIPDALDLTARQLNNRSFATFLFFATGNPKPTYQRVSEICQGQHREYARLALPADDSGDPVIYFLTRDLTPAEFTLDKAAEISQ